MIGREFKIKIKPIGARFQASIQGYEPHTDELFIAYGEDEGKALDALLALLQGDEELLMTLQDDAAVEIAEARRRLHARLDEKSERSVECSGCETVVTDREASACTSPNCPAKAAARLFQMSEGRS